MFHFTQPNIPTQRTFFLLSYVNESCIQPFFVDELGAKILNIPSDTPTNQNIATAISQEFKKLFLQAVLSGDCICSTMTDPKNAIYPWILNLYALKHENSYLIFCNCYLTSSNSYQMKGFMPRKVFEDLIISNPDHILFGVELDSELELTLICYGPAISFLLDYPLPPTCEDQVQLDTLLTPSNYSIMRSHVLQCFNKGGNHSFVYVQDSGPQKHYYNIRMISYFCENRKLIFGSAIDITDYFKGQQNVCLLHQNVIKLFDSFNEAACTLIVGGDRSLAISRNTSKFSELLKLNPNFPFCLLTTEVCNHLLLNNAPLNLKRKLNTNHHSTRLYDVVITPFCRENQGIMLIISALPSSPLYPVNHKVASSLTPREQQVIKFVLNGEKNIVIACHLNITEGTVKRIISNAYKKLNVSSRTELMKNYLVIL